MQPELVEIYRARNAIEAGLLRDRLAEEGIEAFVTNDNLNAGKIDLLGWPTDPAVLVRAADDGAARRIAEMFDDGLPSHPATAFEERAEADAWPLCPGCGARRMTSCPVCQCSGTDFPLGDPAWTDTDEAEGQSATQPALVICPRCDEPFTPHYLPRCEWCGHVFDPDAAAQQPEAPADDTVSHRVGIVLAILALLAAGLVAYLVYLFPYAKP